MIRKCNWKSLMDNHKVIFHMFSHKLNDCFIEKIHKRLKIIKAFDEAKLALRADNENIVKTYHIGNKEPKIHDGHADHDNGDESSDDLEDPVEKGRKKKYENKCQSQIQMVHTMLE